MRAPSAPARLAGLHRPLDLGHRDLVVVAQAAVRGVEQARPARRGRRASSAATAASTRSFSEITCRTRRSSGSGRPSGAGGVAQRVDAQRAAGRAALLAALVVARVGGEVVRGAGVERGQHVAAQVERDRAQRGPAHVDAHGAGRPRRRATASWSSRPVCAPVQSFSTREHSRASADPVGRLGSGDRAEREAERHADGGGRGQAGAAGEVAVDARAGTARSSMPVAPSSAAAPRTNARQPSAPRRSRAPSSKRSRSPRSSACASIAPPASGLGGHRDAALDREREAEAVVVVGVLADQVDPSGGERLDAPPFRAGCVLDGCSSGASAQSILGSVR